MFSKFDSQIHSDEFTAYEPTAADWAEYHEWLHEEEEFQLSAPEGWDFAHYLCDVDCTEDDDYSDCDDDYSDCDDEYYDDYGLCGDFYDND